MKCYNISIKSEFSNWIIFIEQANYIIIDDVFFY